MSFFMLDHFPKAAVLGWPIGHSLSPRLHAYWLQHYGLAGSYTALPVAPEDLGRKFQALADQGFRGFNLTLPHKEAALALVDCLDAEAGQIGAVNLVVREDNRWRGRNTDVYGFTENLKTGGFNRPGGQALVLGAGGAARAVIAALIALGFHSIIVANRSRERAVEVARHFNGAACQVKALPWENADAALAEADLLVNATSLGMQGQPALALSLDRLPVKSMVADIVYKPLQTALLRQAQEKGHPVADGLGMLLHQARPAFQAFFGTDPQVTDELRAYVLGNV